MYNIRLLVALLFCLGLVQLNAQEVKSVNASIPDIISAEADLNNLVYFKFPINKGQTLYSICKFFNVNMQEVMEANHIIDSQHIANSFELKIPINFNQFDTNYKPTETMRPVVYKVKKKETLYRIAKTYFKQEVEDLVIRNGLQSFDLDMGQELVVGYYQLGELKEAHDFPIEIENHQIAKDNNVGYVGTISVDEEGKQHINVNDEAKQEQTEAQIAQKTEGPIPTDIVQEVENPAELKVEEVTVDVEKEVTPAPSYQLVRKKGIAYWDKKGSDYKTLMVLHRDAAINSMITIRNGTTGQEITAKVVGNIPSNAFKKDIDVVLSPAVAKRIGALDSRLQVVMTYSRK